MLIFPVDHLPRLIPVGVQTSKGVEEIGFNVSAWLDKWPDMTFEVWPTRPTETAAYPAVCQLIGDVLVWYVSDADTAFEGLGTVEVVGIAEGIRKPSGPCTTEIKKTSLGVTKEPPEGIKPYYDDMMEAAKVIREGLDGLNADLVGSDGYGGLYIVTCNGKKPNRTQAEIRAAVQARKTVLLRAGTRVYTYFQETQSSNYDEAAAGKTCPTFVRPARQEDGGLRYYEVQVHEDDTITDRGKIGKTPNPNKLTFTGAVEATYDGMETVTVNIPQGGSGGVSDPGTAHLQLVSDENGTAVWVDRLAYKYTGQVEVMPETALTYMGEDEGVQTHALSTSLMGVLDEGKTYQVNYNDTAYDCPIVIADEGKALVLGKTSVLGFEGGNENAPFALIVYNDAETIEGMGGIGGMCASFDGATSVTISISTAAEKIVKLPQEYYDQGDWSADPGTPGHILNRTHWEMQVPDNIMIFDPAKVDEYVKVTHPDSGLVFYKVSDVPINKDTMRGVFDKVVMSVYGETADSDLLGAFQTAHFDDMLETDDVSYSYINDANKGIKLFVVGVRNLGNEEFIQVDFPETGTYIASLDTPLHYVEIKFSADAKVIQRIPKRFVDTDALKSAINDRLPGGNPSTEPGYWRWSGSKWEFATIDQLKADLGLTSGETTTEDVFYTSDGQTFTTLDGAALHVQKGEE